METFYLKPRIRMGADAMEELEHWRGKRVLLVTDGFLNAFGLIRRVTDHLSPELVTVFDRVEPNPTVRLAAEGAALLRQTKPEAVLALGGGSSMDCAKAIRYFGCEKGETIPLWCIPTTAGSGSEVTSFAVLSDTERGVKQPIVDDCLLPEVTLLDGGFLAGAPQQVTADTGMDVIAHALEAYAAKGANPFTDAMASQAFRMAMEELPKAAEGDGGAREKMLYAACLAGIAFNGAGLGACHALSHAMGGQKGMSHGRLNAVFLPHVVQWNGEDGKTAEKYCALCRQSGIPGTVRALTARLVRLRAQLGMPERLLEKADCGRAAQDAVRDKCMGQNPRSMTEEDARRLLQEVCP